MRVDFYRQFHHLMRQFLKDEITVYEFKMEYASLWGKYRFLGVEPESVVQQAAADLIGTAYTDINFYSPNPDRRYREINEEELRELIEEKFKALSEWLERNDNADNE